ncbi:MAG: T9SS type A sorting domain-containing protein [Bacteroidales bacterium]|nr:T9SS type A sorting domain-containing protein [Bacteroidales bacterium]
MKYFVITILTLLIFRLYAQDDKVGCNVVFSYSVQENQLSYFSHKVISGSDMIVSYSWDFGDGYVSDDPNPEHVYLGSGIYTPCLTVVFDNNCTATYCDTIIIRNPVLDTLQNYGISGSVYAGDALLPDGIVVLIKYLNNQYRAVAYCHVDNGNYHFSNLTPGTYYIYAIPYFNINVIFYPNYFPTYYGNTMKWQNAAPVNVNGLHINKNINLQCSYDLILGNDSIVGDVNIADSSNFEYNVYLNNWFDNSLPSQENLNLAPNQVVLLLDSNNIPQRFALTNHNGIFVFKDIPSQIFKVRTEKHGLISQIIEQNAAIDFEPIHFTITSDAVVIGIDNNSLSQIQGSIYPNPVENNLWLRLEYEASITALNIELFDFNGKKIYHNTFKHEEHDTYIIPMVHLNSGVYILKVHAQHFLPKIFKVVKK